MQLQGDSLHLIIGLSMLSHNIKVAFVKSVSRTKKSKAVVKTETSTLVGWVKKNFASKTGIGKAAVPNISEALRQQRKNDRTSTHLQKAGSTENNDVFGAVMDAFTDDSIKPYAVIEPDPIEVPAEPKSDPNKFVLFKRKPARSKA